jgi:hypothetical protein
MTVTLNLAPDLVLRLQKIAEQQGKTLELYLNELAERAVEGGEWSAKHQPNLQKELTPKQWAAELRAWATSHPPVSHFIDDSRESIYAGRGE